jgi:predicted transposase YbfD/YdcC
MIYHHLLVMREAEKAQMLRFIDAVEKLKDHRDNRGKRHSLSFVLCGAVLAIMSGRAKMSSIHRYIENRLAWLRAVTNQPHAAAVSRAQLPRILATIDRPALNAITMAHFGVNLIEDCDQKWTAVDGKALRGTADGAGNQRVRIVTAVEHESRETIAQCEMNSAKKGEITAVRTFLQETALEKANITLDALHMNPTTTAQIEQAGGHYIIQTKRNQPELCDSLTRIAETTTPFAIFKQHEKGHGRHEERWAWFFDISAVDFDERWQPSALRTFALVMRQTISTADPTKISLDLSYYLSNCPLTGEAAVQPEPLAQAIRRHWGVESVNWIRDVTFQEDHVQTKDAYLAQVLATIRTFAIRLFQRAKLPNLQAALERFADCPDDFSAFLNEAHVL